MWKTNLKVLLVVLGTLGTYTLVASSIPQIESEVPEELAFGADVNEAELVAAGQVLFDGAGGCTARHGLGTRAPNLISDEGGTGTIGQRCATRVEGEDCQEYLWKSMVDPTAYVVEGYDPIMADQRRILSNNQIWAVIAYLQDQGGTVTVTAEDIAATADETAAANAGPAAAGGAGAEGAGGGAAAGGPSGAAGGTDAVALMENNLCFNCHVLGERGIELGPPLDGIGARRDAAYIRRSILDPNAEAPEGYEALLGSMPPNFGELFTAAQLETIVQYLAGLQ